MSIASRLPREVSATAPASWPKLVCHRTGRVDRAAVRREVQSYTRSPTPALRWPAPRALAAVFQKVRLQVNWARAAIARRAEEAARARAEQAAFEAEARQLAMRTNYNTALLRHLRNRYAYGSLADTWRAAHERRVHDRALAIACERADSEDERLAAAE
jgi:hypothetical protein